MPMLTTAAASMRLPIDLYGQFPPQQQGNFPLPPQDHQYTGGV